MPRYLLARDCAEMISKELDVSLSDVVDVLVNVPVGDVIPRSEVNKLLLDLKKEIHDHAIYPHGAGINPYISLRVIDAIIQDALKKGGKSE